MSIDKKKYTRVSSKFSKEDHKRLVKCCNAVNESISRFIEERILNYLECWESIYDSKGE